MFFMVAILDDRILTNDVIWLAEGTKNREVLKFRL